MRTGLPWILGAWILAVTPLFAQTPLPSPPNPPVFVPAVPEGPVTSFAQPPVPDTFRFWVRAEYLSYWVKNTPLPISLVTGDPNNPNPTQELLNSDRSFGMFSGFRVGLGGWLDPDNIIGLEANVFSLNRRTRQFSASSDDNGSPTLAFPFINQDPSAVGNNPRFITMPGVFAGGVVVTSTLELWGTEFNAAFSLLRERDYEFTALAGFRYANLYETLNISTISNALATTPTTDLFQSDQFNTRNQFYGGQIGGRFNWQGERFGLDVTGKLAIGVTHQTVDISGFSAQTGPGGPNGVFPGGFFTQPSNIGHYTANQFGLIPSVEMKFYVLITSHLRAFVGYDFMYWNQVVRPGSQVDRNINQSQSAVLGGGALNGPAFPMPLFTRTDFWAQGVTLGFEFRF